VPNWRGPVAPSDEGHESNEFDNITTGADLLAPWRGMAVLDRVARAVFGAAEDAVRRRFAGLRPGPGGVRTLAGFTALLLALGSLGALSLARPTAEVAGPGLLAGAADPVAHLRIRIVETEVAGARVESPATPPVETVAATATPVATAPSSAPNLLPTGKGMWFHKLEQAGSVPDIIDRAKASGLSHLYLRLGSSRSGFYAQGDLDALLPAAHAAGLKVVGWDFPYLDDVNVDVARALEQIAYTTPDGHRIDAFSADIETGSEGVRLSADRVEYYARNVRYYAGPGYPLIGTVPNACLNASFPYAEVAASFDAIAPMVYWITRDPAADVACNMERLAPLGRPVLPVGQAYDPAIDNPTLTNLVPGYQHLDAFMVAAAERGAAGVSFWAWHTATPEMWQAVTDMPHFSLTPMTTGHRDGAQVVVLQRLLNAYGYTVPVDGRYEAATVGALAQLQNDLGLPPTGQLDAVTLTALNGRR